jgi:hypothetical protein
MKRIIYTVAALTFLYGCEKEPETNKTSDTNIKDIPYILRKMANEYKGEINALVDNIDDTLAIRCQGLSVFIPNLDTFKLKYIDLIALGIGKNVYCGSTGNYSGEYVKDRDGKSVSIQEFGNRYFYIYSDCYLLDPDSSYSIYNLRFLYNTYEAPFK